MSIGLGLDDLTILEYILSVLKLGKISIFRDHKSPNCRLIINKTDLQEIVFPLLIHHGIFFLTETRRSQFDLAMFIFTRPEAYIKCASENIPKNGLEIPKNFELPKTASGYLNLAFFNNWLVGFTNAEGTFLIKNNKDGCFQLNQRIHIQLFEAFKLLFNSNRKLTIEKDKYIQFSLSSKNDIQKVINFFSFSGCHPLVGLKSIQYLKWLTNLRNSERYKNLHFPPLFPPLPLLIT